MKRSLPATIEDIDSSAKAYVKQHITTNLEVTSKSSRIFISQERKPMRRNSNPILKPKRIPARFRSGNQSWGKISYDLGPLMQEEEEIPEAAVVGPDMDESVPTTQSTQIFFCLRR
jgi:hypothetical protein